MTENKNGDLRVWWIPQIPGKSFKVPVKDIVEGVKVLDVLASYDLFQLANNIKGDYCNAGGLQVFVDDAFGNGNPDWCDWYDEETGEDNPKKYLEKRKVIIDKLCDIDHTILHDEDATERFIKANAKSIR
jgi:hypothetical protein